MKSKTIEQNLYDITCLQQGYFTAPQAKKAGYSDRVALLIMLERKTGLEQDEEYINYLTIH